LPGEAAETTEIPLAPSAPVAPPVQAVQAVQPAQSARRPAAGPAKPQLAAAPLWPVPEEARGRNWLVIMAFLVIIGLYSYMLSCFYAGAHGGVDQAGYLLTARLLSGDRNIDAPAAPAPPRSVAATAPAATVPAEKAPAVWPGSSAGYTDDHPAPAAIQVAPRFDWLRNRLSFVPESPFQFASRMCIMTEPFGPALAPAAGGGEPAAAEYRIFAKYPFGFSALSALGRTVAARFDHQMYLATVPGSAPAAQKAASAEGPEASASRPATGKPAAGQTKVVAQPAVGRGFAGMYIINPLCTVLACFFAYFLFRQAVSPFVALIGVLWLATNPAVLAYSNDANSHASTLFCVCLGFWGVISFLRTQGIWRACIGGFALGYACTIRYSEFLLVLPVVFAAVINFRFTARRALGSLSLLTSWAIPVAVLAAVCWISFGSPTKTGYTYCNEDTGFGWAYLTGNFGDHQVPGNWETFITQINRTGLFILWPLAMAGLFGMLGSAWRLGGLLVLWIVPSTLVYMAYYWAPANSDTQINYLRFFVSTMPGLIFAGIWVLERALASVKGDKWIGLITGTALGVFLLLVIAFYADGGPATVDGGLRKMVGGFMEQAPSALQHLVTGSRLGLVCACVILAAIVGMWLFDRHLIASRLGIALGAGAITALGCAINLYTILPQLETTHIRWTVLRSVVDNMRETVPPGSVVFSEDNLLNQLDCVGGWKLYNVNDFSPAAYQQAKNRVDQRNTPDRLDDPDPLQNERARFYMELLSQPSAVCNVSLGARSAADIRQMQKAIIDRNVANGHRIVFLALLSPGDMAGGVTSSKPSVEGYTTRELRRWTVSAPPSGVVSEGAATAFAGVGPKGPPLPGARGRGKGRGAGALARAGGVGLIPPAPAVSANPIPRQGPTYVLWELVRKTGDLAGDRH
jgi:hypothetical protein